MADLWMDVDAALSEVPVNAFPLIDDTDFKTREESVAYDAAGMDLIWHFVTPAGAYTATAVTPTTGGDYDWAHQDGGMYTIEIPASGGASINNDTEGFGWFTGFATGILPWRGPIIGFRAAGLNGLLIEDAFSATRGLAGTALPAAAADAAGGLVVSDAGALDIDAKLAATNEVTAARMGALTDWIDGGRLDLIIDAVLARLPASLVSGRIDASVGAVAANAITATAIASNAITAAKIATDAITAAKIAADAIGASELATDAVSEIRDAILNRVLATNHETAGSAGKLIQSITEARLAELDAANLPADGDTIKAAVAAAAIRTALGLAAADLDTQLGAKPTAAEIKTAIEAAGSHLALIKAVTDAIPDGGALTALLADLAAVLLDTGTTLPATLAALNNLSAAEVNAQVVDVLRTDTLSENAQGIPPATPTFQEAVMLLYMRLRNKLTTTATELGIYNDAGTKIAKKTLSDDGTTYTEGEAVSGA